MATVRSKVPVVVVSVLAAIALAGYLWTAQNPYVAIHRAAPPAQSGLVDDRPLRRTRALQALVNTSEEQQVAAEAARIADHEVDQAFAAALRQAQLSAPALTAEAQVITARQRKLEQAVQQDNDRVTRLQATVQREPDNQSAANDVEIAKAQSSLDTDELHEARQDLQRVTGNPVEKIQQQLTAYENSNKESDSSAKESKPATFQAAGLTLASHFEEWWALHLKQVKLQEATLETLTSAAELTATHNSMKAAEAASLAAHASATKGANGHADVSSTIGQLQYSHQLHGLDSINEDRIATLQHLAQVYQAWEGVVGSQLQSVWHAALGSVLLILAILLGVAGVVRIVDKIYRAGEQADRRLLTTRVAYRSAIQAVGILLVLLAIFGVPNQIATVLALAGAGLTVAFKDYIVGFFGWFTLMGRSGIRQGDWVEIDGIAGEVLEISPLHTLLLETSSWNDAGYPTGRKVSFVNSFAIEGHYFNFTTGDRWLWDELEIPIPPGGEPSRLADSIRTLVCAETAEWTTLAEREWQEARCGGAGQAPSASPMINLRPTAAGVNVIVRYVTQVSCRNEVRSRLYQAIVSCLYSKDRDKDVPAAPDLMETPAVAHG